jgi:hypothetical protein
MLKVLKLENVGPVRELNMALAPRLNLITGDNGLGKSFLLDVAWWSLTRKWPRELNPRLTSGYRAEPRDLERRATISFEVEALTGSKPYDSTYSRADEAWTGKRGRPPNNGLVVYAHSDGAFSVWDPARNYFRKSPNGDAQDRPAAYVFSPQDVWDGLRREADRRVYCNGLLADVSTWQLENGRLHKMMVGVLQELSPVGEGDTLTLGPLGRLFPDVRTMPTIGSLKSGYGLLVHASSGVRRIVALAYMLLWTWSEHRAAAEKLGQAPAANVTLLVDEIETHLHPRWQRTILKSLIGLTRELLFDDSSIQILATTHSPLVLASCEPFFEEPSDAWFDLDLVNGSPELTKRVFMRQGDVTNWLASEAFDLESGRSLEAGIAIAAAKKLLRRAEPPQLSEVLKVDEQIQNARLPDIDAFGARWVEYVEARRQGKTE